MEYKEMRYERMSMYIQSLDREIEKDYPIYTKNEIIEFTKNLEDVDEWCLELYAPCGFKLTIENIEKTDKDDEFIVVEENKEVCLLMDE